MMLGALGGVIVFALFAAYYIVKARAAAAILRYIRRYGPSFALDIQEETGLPLPVIHTVLQDLERVGVLRSFTCEAAQTVRRGRPRRYYRLALGERNRGW